VIIVVVLQNSVDLLEGEVGSSGKTCVTSTLDGNQVTDIEAVWVTDIKKEEDEESVTIPEIKTEPKVNGLPVVKVWKFVIGYISRPAIPYITVSLLNKF